MAFVFCFCRASSHRGLHSFPTRRSSDLNRSTCGSAPAPRTDAVRHRAATARPNDSRPLRRRRSEEHTSELQSHSDLVCRLLLEKKKIVQVANTNDGHHTTLNSLNVDIEP